MFCNKCGSQLPPNSKFCNNCGVPVNELPEEFVNWARYPLSLPEDATTLPFKGLYNVDEQYGFVGEK